MISVKLNGRLGNQLWQYAVCRLVAEKLGYDFHIPRSFLGKDFFRCSLGVPEEKVEQIHCEYAHSHIDIQKYDPAIFQIKDNTRLVGFFQTEKYLAENAIGVKKWFAIPDCDSLANQTLTKNTCVIHFRGGDYKGKYLFLPAKYYYDCICKMQKNNPESEFLIVTDDIEAARDVFSTLPIADLNSFDSFCLLCRAEYLIISNSTFSWWASWLNEKAKIILAPKYWFGYNSEEWKPSGSFTSKLTYISR